MPDEKITATPQDESSEDRFEHEIEELEANAWRHNPTLIVTVLALVVIVGAGITYLFMTEKKQNKPTGPIVMQIEMLEPRSGTLSNTPTKFRWETISGTKYYSFTLSGKGVASALFQRAPVNPSVTLTPDEVNRLAKGAGYTWKVEAFSDTGKVLARGESAFDL
jgi:hypothetical protein